MTKFSWPSTVFNQCHSVVILMFPSQSDISSKSYSFKFGIPRILITLKEMETTKEQESIQ